MPVRCKFQLTSIKQLAWNKEARELEFTAQYDETIPEDRRFAKYTPSGSFKMLVDNPAVIEQLELGEQYFFDITKVEKPEAPPA